MGKKTSKTSTNSQPWKPAQGDILGSIGTVRNTVGNNQPYLDQMAGDIRGQLPGLANKAFGPNPLLDTGNQYAMDVLGGKYLNANPHLDGMINSTADDVSDRVNSLFSRSGASLGTRHAGVLTSELAQAENQMRYGNYAQERQNQMGAAGMVPGLNQAQYAGVLPYATLAQTGANMPYAGIGALNPIIGLANQSGQQSGTQPGGWGNDLLSAAAAIGSAAIMASSRELKTDIEEIGDWDNRGDGLKRVRFRYRNDPARTMLEGVIAEDVLRLRPWAYVPNFTRSGHPAVNYAKLKDAA